MAKVKFDGVIESVRYGPDGRVEYVRVYERRGATFSDWFLLDRQSLIERLKAKKRFYTGRRKEYLASTFELGSQVMYMDRGGDGIITTDAQASDRDLIAYTPVF